MGYFEAFINIITFTGRLIGVLYNILFYCSPSAELFQSAKLVSLHYQYALKLNMLEQFARYLSPPSQPFAWQEP